MGFNPELLLVELCSSTFWKGRTDTGKGGFTVAALSYPSFSIPSLEAFLGKAAARMPERIDLPYLMETVGLTEKNAELLLEGLQTLGCVSEDGRLTAEGHTLATEEGRAGAYGRALTRVYVGLLDVLLQKEEFNLDQVHQFLADRNDLRLSGRQKVAAVFRYFLLNSDREDLKSRFSQKKCFA